MSEPVDSIEKGNNDGAGGEVDGEPVRQTWGGKLEFLLTCVGYAVGLGNVWRFPYLCYQNGGGAFLIPYVIMLFIIGLPVFFLEVSFGQFASLGPIPIWRINPLMKGLGFASVIVAAYICLYYNVIVSWCLYYFFASMTSELPWTTCDNWWNTELCIDGNSTMNATAANVTTKTASEEYYYNQVLRMEDGIGMENMGNIVWQLALCLALTWVIVFCVLIKGIQSLGKASYFVSLFPYVLLTIMLVRGATLPGAATGIEFYLKPDWERLTDAKVWTDAATQIFYSLGVSMAGLIAMSSYNNFNNNIFKDALIIPFVNCGTSIYAGFVIFSVLGYMAEEKGVPVSEVAAEGPGLVFVVYPEGLATMPVAPLWSVLFFFMMTTLGFSSQFSTTEGVISAFVDEYPDTLRVGNRPMIMRGCLCFTFFLLGLPMVTQGGFYLFKIVDDYCAGYPLLVVAFLELITICWTYGFNRWSEDISLMIGQKPNIFFKITWQYVSPAVIVVTFISKAINQTPLSFEGYTYPDWANSLAWMIVAFPIVAIVAVFLITYCANGGYQVLVNAGSPTPEWGPANPEDRRGRYAMPVEPEVELQVSPPPYVISKRASMTSRSSISGSSNGGLNNMAFETDPSVVKF